MRIVDSKVHKRLAAGMMLSSLCLGGIAICLLSVQPACLHVLSEDAAGRAIAPR